MTHPLWRPYEQVENDDSVWVSGSRPRATGRRIEVATPDPEWPAHFAELAAGIRLALGGRVLALEHVGSTSVPGLAAKPVIDIDLLVGDSADEEAYVPALAANGWELVIREPDWEQHRCFGHPNGRRSNLHVFSAGAVEPQRHLLFRDWLRANVADRVAYAAVKLDLAGQPFDSVVDYNNAKSALIYDIYERAFAADPAHPHDPRPRRA